MDGNGGVYDGWLDSLLLNDGLNVLVHMMVDVLASNGGLRGRGGLHVANGAGILELGLISSEAVLDV